MVTYSSAKYEDYVFPAWADALGWMIGIATLLPMPVFAVYIGLVQKVVSKVPT